MNTAIASAGGTDLISADDNFYRWLRQGRARGSVWRCSRSRHVTKWDIPAAQLPIGDAMGKSGINSAGFGTAEMTGSKVFCRYRF